MTKSQRYKRKAAGKVFLHLFAVMDNVMFQMSFNHLLWGDDLLTPAEKAYVDKLKLRVHRDAELCRVMGNRLEKP